MMRAEKKSRVGRSAWDEGEDAAKAGKEHDDCPYREDGMERRNWLAGWKAGEAARAASRERLKGLAIAKAVPFHPVADLFPLMDCSDLAALAEDIKVNGQRQGIWVWEGQIIDGRNRYEACKLAGAAPRFREWDGKGDVVRFVLSLNLHRRHLSESQRAAIAAKVATMRQGERTDLASIEAKSERGKSPTKVPRGMSQAEAATSSTCRGRASSGQRR
jgi:ribosome modulation factor